MRMPRFVSVLWIPALMLSRPSVILLPIDPHSSWSSRLGRSLRSCRLLGRRGHIVVGWAAGGACSTCPCATVVNSRTTFVVGWVAGGAHSTCPRTTIVGFRTTWRKGAWRRVIGVPHVRTIVLL